MKVGDRVEVRAGWSSFFGMRGTVASTAPFLMVVVDGDKRPIRMGEGEVVLHEEPKHHAGAE